jgi:hypothetical protein
MGQSKSGGYMKMPTGTDQQTAMGNQAINQYGNQSQLAQAGYEQFLPGGQGQQSIINAAQQRFQQQTLPSIMEAMGSGSKTSSGLNQAMGAAGSDFQTQLQALLSQNQLTAAQGMGGLAQNSAQIGMQPQFAYMQKQQPYWQSILSSLVGAGGQVLGGALGKPPGINLGQKG